MALVDADLVQEDYGLWIDAPHTRQAVNENHELYDQGHEDNGNEDYCQIAELARIGRSGCVTVEHAEHVCDEPSASRCFEVVGVHQSHPLLQAIGLPRVGKEIVARRDRSR